jgi:uncharacterized protein DUF4424
VIKKLAIVVAVLAFGGAAATAEANDTRAQFKGGQLRFVKSDGIVMEAETLTISRDLVTVEYVFRNITDHAIETEVAFPIRNDFSKEGIDDEELAKRPKDWQPYPEAHSGRAFKLLVNGEPRSFKELWRGSDTETEFSYLWTQKFPARATVNVRHQYFPSGRTVGPGRRSDPMWTALQRGYCVGPKLIAAMDGFVMLTKLTYILKTGANWDGPIRHFRLILKKASPTQRVSLCWNGLKKTSDTTFELEKVDFTPTEDLTLVFLDEVQCVDPKTHAPRKCASD